MLTSMICAPLSTCWRATSSARRSRRLDQLANFAEPVTLVRSPTLTKFESGPMFSGSRPAGGSASAIGDRRGGTPATASAMARMCAGVVPQQPPTMLSSPLSANSREDRGHRLRRLVVAAERVRQAGVGVQR
jgi:hypothetical protein